MSGVATSAGLGGLAAAAGLAALLVLCRELRRTRAAVSRLERQIEKCEACVKDQHDDLCKHQHQLAAMWHSQSVVFTVAQYNILAAYLGDNRQPWFLYGVSGLTEERREEIMAKFYERGADGKFCNVGWPKYVEGLLSAEEQRVVEAEHARHFAWEARRDRLLETVRGTHADIISLVELDHYDHFWRPQMLKLGFDSAYRKRPRAASADGCGIFWRKHLFELVDEDHLEFVDRGDPETGKISKDRCALFVLLRHTHSAERLIFISTHLARNPEDCAQTKMRAKQAAALFQKLTPFAAQHDALDAPVILAGDLNTTNIRQLGNIARAVLELCDQPVHPFVFSAMATRSLPTSVTSTRRMRIDYLLHSSAVQLVDAPNMPALSTPIPDADHPSDHIPLVIKVRLKSELSQLHETARGWCLMVLADGTQEDYAGPAVPLSSEELDKAFAFFDVDADGRGITEAELHAGMRDLSFEHRTPQLLQVLRRELMHGAASGSQQAGALPIAKNPRTGEWDVMPLQRACFRRAYVRCFERMRSSFRAEMYEAFSYFDTDASGVLTHEELRASFRAACPFDVEDADFETIWQTLDKNRDGEITLDEFVDSIINQQYNQHSRIKKMTTSSLSALHRSPADSAPTRAERCRSNLALINEQSKGYAPRVRHSADT